jgi:hypothetical protein
MMRIARSIVHGWARAGALALATALGLACNDGPSPAALSGSFTATAPGGAAPSDGGVSPTNVAAPASVASVQALLGQLERMTGDNGGSYSQVDLEDLNDLLTDALLRAAALGGRGAASSQCVLQAVHTHGFSPAQAAALCVDTLADPAACAGAAVEQYGFDRDAAVALCATRGGLDTATCGGNVFGTLGLSRAQAVAVCADREGGATAECAASAVRNGLNDAQASVLCAHRGGASTADCAHVAMLTFRFAPDDAVALCANRGTSETAACAGLCSNRGQTANANCANAATSTAALTRDQAVLACHRPPTQD